MESLKVTTRDGKYSIVIQSDGLPVYLERYGELWSPKNKEPKYVGLFISVAYELLELRRALEEALDTLSVFDKERIITKLRNGEYQ